KLDLPLRAAAWEGGGDALTLIIQTETTPTPADMERIWHLGGRVTAKYRVIPAFSATVPRAALPALAAEKRFRHLSSDFSVHKSEEFVVPATGADVAYAQYAATGQGVGIAFLDSGINQHDDLYDNPYSTKTRIKAKVSFVPADSSTADVCGH